MTGASVVLVREPFTVDRLARVREIVSWAAAKVGLSLARAERYILAVSEAVTNAIVHGGGRGYLELVHTNQRALTARVIDHGTGMPVLGPIQRPPTSAIRGRGRWLMANAATRSVTSPVQPAHGRARCETAIALKPSGDRRGYAQIGADDHEPHSGVTQVDLPGRGRTTWWAGRLTGRVEGISDASHVLHRVSGAIVAQGKARNDRGPARGKRRR